MNEQSLIPHPLATAAAAPRMSEPTNNPPATVTGGSKRYKNKQPPLTIPAGCIGFQLLCHASRIGGVIGKSGSIIKQVQQETSAKIRVEGPPPGSDERVITIIANSSVNKTITFVEHNSQNKNCDEGGEHIEVSAAQEALIRVFERSLLAAAEVDGVYSAPGGVASCRLLAEKSAIGSVIGKGGKVIEKIRKDTGCKIKIFGPDKMPSCSQTSCEMVEIEGDILAVKKAIVSVSRCLQDCPHAHKRRTILGTPHLSVPQETVPDGHMDFPPPQTQAFHATSTTYANHAVTYPPASLDNDTIPSMDSQTSQQEIVFRMLCADDRVGLVIGKSGTIIQSIEKESGATISVGAPVSDCDERVITIAAKESPESHNSPAQNAVILVFNRCVEAGFPKGMDPSSTGTPVSARLLVSQNQIGCVLGKGGAIITDMRKVTGAAMKIVGGNQLPKCASETDRVVMMTGESVNVRDALYSVTGRLRNNIFSGKTSNGLRTRGMHGRGNGYSNQHTTLAQSMGSLKLSSSMDRPIRHAHWQSPMGASNPGTGQDATAKGGIELGGGGRSAVVTNMSVEIPVPQNAITSVYGENGSNLTRLREISGATVEVHEPRSGTPDHIVVISGTPDETKSAQSLLQAFILAGQS